MSSLKIIQLKKSLKQNKLNQKIKPSLYHFVKIWYKGGVETFIETLNDERYAKETIVNNDLNVFSFLFSKKEHNKFDVYCFHTPLYFLSLSFIIFHGLQGKVIIHNDLKLLYTPLKKIIAYPWIYLLMKLGIKVIYFNPSNSFLSNLSHNAIKGKYLDSIFSKEKVNIDKGRRDILFVGRYHHSKGFDKAISMISKLDKGFSFKVFGDFPKNIIKKYSNDLINFYGFEQNLSKIYSKNSLLLICSDYESGPLVAFEALAYGVPVLTTKVGVFQEMDISEQFNYLTIYNSQKDGIHFLKQFINLETFSSRGNIEFLESNLNSVREFFDKYLIDNNES